MNVNALKVLFFVSIYLHGLLFISAIGDRYVMKEIPKVLVNLLKNDSYSFDNGKMSFLMDETVWSENSDSELSIPNHIIKKREFKHTNWNNELPILKNTFFPSLPSYHKRGNTHYDDKYPWMTRIVQTTGLSGNPHMCTGVAIHPRIVVAAARCVSGLTISYTKVVQYNRRSNIFLLILPVNISKQAYDDIGFLISDDKKNNLSYVPFIEGLKRTDNKYDWFRNSYLNDESKRYKAIGFAPDYDIYQKEGLHMYTYYGLVEVEVQISIDICHKIYAKGQFDGYKVPCYHTCSYEEHVADNDKCKTYLGVEGAAIYDKENDKVIGLATWGYESREKNYPVGFAVLNSAPFLRNYGCGLHAWWVKVINQSKFVSHHHFCTLGCNASETMWYYNFFETTKLDNLTTG